MKWLEISQIWRNRRALRSAALLAAAALLTMPVRYALAQEPASASASAPTESVTLPAIPVTAPAATPPKKACVDTAASGAPALSYDCLSQQLAPTPTTPADGSAGNVAEGLATGASNKVGTFNYSAESIRYGSNWGKSVLPQRPPPMVPTPLR
jgi:hypothetical protein